MHRNAKRLVTYCSPLAWAAPSPDLRQENTECRSGIFRTSVGRRPSILGEPVPKKACGLFRFDPLVLPDLLFDKVGDPVRRIGIHHQTRDPGFFRHRHEPLVSNGKAGSMFLIFRTPFSK